MIKDKFNLPSSSSHPDDWHYDFLSRKWFNIIHAHLGTDPKKIIEPAERCGFEAWRLLHKEYDPVTTDMAYTLMAALHKISKWTVKGVVEENAAMREAEKRLRELER